MLQTVKDRGLILLLILHLHTSRTPLYQPKVDGIIANDHSSLEFVELSEQAVVQSSPLGYFIGQIILCGTNHPTCCPPSGMKSRLNLCPSASDELRLLSLHGPRLRTKYRFRWVGITAMSGYGFLRCMYIRSQPLNTRWS